MKMHSDFWNSKYRVYCKVEDRSSWPLGLHLNWFSCEKHILSNEVVFICQRDVVWLAVAMSFQKRSAEG